MPEVKIEILGPEVDHEVVADVTDLVNEAYAEAEEGLWRSGTTRTTSDEVLRLIRSGEIVVARRRERIVGCVRVQRIGDSVGEFGMLAVHPESQGSGTGRELVAFAEDLSRERGLGTMRLELLVPPYLEACRERTSSRLVHAPWLSQGPPRAHRRAVPDACAAVGDAVRLRDLPQAPRPLMPL